MRLPASSFTLLKNAASICVFAALAGQAAAQQYTVLNSSVKEVEAPWIFDGKQIGKGLATHIANADTAENRRACANEWKGAAGYRILCRNLADLKIVTVRLTDLNHYSTTLVPVSRIAKITSGDEVLIRMADLSQNNAVRSLPVFLRVLPKKEGQQSLVDSWRKQI